MVDSITHLTFGTCFNQSIDIFPNSITHLTFGYEFNQKINLSNQIMYLKLDCNNQYLIDNFPHSIKELELDYAFDLKLNNLPNSIKKITFYKQCFTLKKL